MKRLSFWLALLLGIGLMPGCAPPAPTVVVATLPAERTATPTRAAALRSTRSPTRTPRPIQATATPAATARPTRRSPSATAAPVTTGLPEPVSAPDPLVALHSAGQTFLVWDEIPDQPGARYRIYRSHDPITAENFMTADWLGEVAGGSGRFYADRFYDPAANTWQPRFFQRYIIQDGQSELPEGEGLFVWTPSQEDVGLFNDPAYYAVTIQTPDGAETLAGGYSAGPLTETAADPLPVVTRAQAGPAAHVLIQYMDLRMWNPTFHAPNPLNRFYGLDPGNPAFEGTLQYAYAYVVFDPVCSAGQTRAPVVLLLHDLDNYQTGVPRISNEMMMWCAYKVVPLDPSDTWWFGFGEFHDYRSDSRLDADQSVANFTEQRVLRMLYDLRRAPTSLPVDPERVYVIGQGMGASGALALAARYPHIFAAAYASQPVTVFDTALERLPGLVGLWGRRELSLPVTLNAPGGWALPLLNFNGDSVWRLLSLPTLLKRLDGLDIAPLGVAHGARDPLADPLTQALALYAALDDERQVWGGLVVDAEHTRLDYLGLPPALQPNDLYIPFAGLRVVRNETVPGLSGGTLDQPEGSYNQTILWSASWLPWDGAPVDEIDRWEMSLCAIGPQSDPRPTCGAGIEQRVDVTPRRMQRFMILPGMVYDWENRRVSDGERIAFGTVTASQNGRLTVPGFLVSPEGNRLVLRPRGESGDQ